MTTDARSRLVTGTISVTTLLGFAFGVTFLVIMLVFAVAFPNPEPFQVRVFIVVLALAAGGVGAVLPGQIEVRHKNWLRAGGALALVVLVITFQPVLEQKVITYKTPVEDPLPIAQDYLALNDTGAIGLAWNTLDPAVRELSFASLAKYREMYTNFRLPLGKVESRKFVGAGTAQSPSGLPVGLYRHIWFSTHFAADNGCRFETVVLRASRDVQWRVATYIIEARPGPCGRQPVIAPPTSL